MKSIFKVLLVVGLLAALSYCSLFPDKPDLAAPDQLTITALGESMTISWDAVSDATSYDLYYTDDGTSPSISSSVLSDVTTPYTHAALDETKTYKYMLRAKADGFSPSSSPVSEGYRPEPMLHITVTATGYANQPLLLYMFDAAISGDPITTEIVAGTTDSNGVCVLHGTMDYTLKPGYTIVKDIDANGVMSTDDLVWGAGGGSYNYMAYANPPVNSWSSTVDWDNWRETDPQTNPY